MIAQFWIVTGAVLGFFGVAFGAFGAHALRDRLEPQMLAVFQTGVQYHFIHALALILFGLWMRQSPHASPIAGWAFLIGVIVFSGSLYLLAVTGVKWLGAITPIGGIAFMVGWCLFALAAYKNGG